MRNEIFARHGQIFKTQEMKEYFDRQNWYEAKIDNASDKLSELEKINVQLIKRFEKRKAELK